VKMGNKRYEKYKESYKRYREENKDKIAKMNRDYREKNKEKVKRIAEVYRNQSRFGGLRDFILERDNWKCIKCDMSQEQHMVIFSRSLTIDHIDGNGRGSTNQNNDPSNLQTLCLRCHGKKDILRHPQFKKSEGQQ